MAGKNTLIFDCETLSADLLYTTRPEDFVRLIGYRFENQPVVITTDIYELRDQIETADLVVGHNITSFDLPAVFGVGSDYPLQLAEEGRVYDTWVEAPLVFPAPAVYQNRHGKGARADSPESQKAWFSLDELAFQLGVPGKTDSIKELAREYGGFDRVPIDDERFRRYLVGDVEASEAVAKALWRISPPDDYSRREHRIHARTAVMTANGFRVDTLAAEQRVEELARRREIIMVNLVKSHDFPTEGKSPWASAAGKEAIVEALAANGITPETRPDWPRTPKGALQLGGQVLIGLTAGTEAEDMGTALAELKGQRSLAQLALDSTHSDGFAHPQVSMLQRSGRASTTNPGLTVWTARGAGAVEKAYFLPDNPDEVLIGLDYSNADARMVCALSGDEKYAERFKPGQDGHRINAVAAWGQEVVDTDPAGYRQKAKILGHGWNYNGGAKTLSAQTGVPLEQAKTFCDGLAKAFPRLMQWRKQMATEARRGYVTNDWGRRMQIEKGREFTQGPALLGQSGTREIVCDALLRLDVEDLRRLKAWIHDELVFSVPRDEVHEWVEYLTDMMEATFRPKRGGLVMNFPVSAGKPGSNWYEASH